MIEAILIVALKMTLGLAMQAAQYALMGFCMAYAGRRGWEARKR